MRIKIVILLSVVLGSGILNLISHDLIESVVIKKNRIKVIAHPMFKKKYLSQNFFAEYDTDIDLTRLHQSIVLIPFISSVITAVWASDQDYYIDYLDADFAAGLEKIHASMKKMYPSLQWAGRLIPRKLIHNKRLGENDTIAVLFSAGVDTTATSLRHHDRKQYLITVWGSDVTPHDTDMWKGVERICKDFAKAYGHEHTYVRSNFIGLFKDALYNLTPEIPRWWKCTSMGLSYCGLAAPILVANFMCFPFC